VSQLEAFGIPYTRRIASAHKSPRYLLEAIDGYNQSGEAVVFIAVAGRSNALGGLLDANTPFPVINCPPASSSFGGADVYSSLRMPSGVAPMVILEPENTALAAAKILALFDADLRGRVLAYQQGMMDSIIQADRSLV
jgi:phosphoribosylaminoimidazole carboxylase PurE protein